MVYVYIKESVEDFDDSMNVLVFDTLEKARAALREDRETIIDYWEDSGIIAVDSPDCFCACDEGSYARNHDHLFILKREIK